MTFDSNDGFEVDIRSVLRTLTVTSCWIIKKDHSNLQIRLIIAYNRALIACEKPFSTPPHCHIGCLCLEMPLYITRECHMLCFVKTHPVSLRIYVTGMKNSLHWLVSIDHFKWIFCKQSLLNSVTLSMHLFNRCCASVRILLVTFFSSLEEYT